MKRGREYGTENQRAVHFYDAAFATSKDDCV